MLPSRMLNPVHRNPPRVLVVDGLPRAIFLADERGSLRRLESATETGLPHEEVGVVSGELPVQPGE